MKKIFTLLFACITFLGYAQIFQLTDSKGVPYSDGQTISATITMADLDPLNEYVTLINVNNLTDQDLEVRAVRTNIALPVDTMAYVCFSLCYFYDSYDITSWPIAGAGTEPFTLHLKPMIDNETCYYGLCQFKIDFSAEGESMTLYVNVEVLPLAIKEHNLMNASITAYPNPAPINSIINVAYAITDNSEKHNLVIRNILGAEVLNIPLNPYENAISVDVSTLKRGAYFYAIENKNQILIAKKLIIN